MTEIKMIARPWTPQDLLDDLQDIINEESDNYLNTRRTTLEMALAYLKEHFAEQKWIPVTERLPERMMQCVCQYVFGDGTEYPFYAVMWYFANDKVPHFQNEGSMGLRVTHWMPLPEPPKE